MPYSTTEFLDFLVEILSNRYLLNELCAQDLTAYALSPQFYENACHLLINLICPAATAEQEQRHRRSLGEEGTDIPKKDGSQVETRDPTVTAAIHEMISELNANLRHAREENRDLASKNCDLQLTITVRDQTAAQLAAKINESEAKNRALTHEHHKLRKTISDRENTIVNLTVSSSGSLPDSSYTPTPSLSSHNTNNLNIASAGARLTDETTTEGRSRKDKHFRILAQWYQNARAKNDSGLFNMRLDEWLDAQPPKNHAAVEELREALLGEEIGRKP